IFGGGPGGGPRVLTLDGKMLAAGDVAGAQAAPVTNFFAGADTDRGGVRVAAKDADGDGQADLGVGSGDAGTVYVCLGKDLTSAGVPGQAQSVGPFDPVPLPGGVFVG